MMCAVILAAGEGRRLRPLTAVRPKALCPVGNVALLDLALRRGGGRATLSVESDGPLGTSGGVGNLRDWIAGRGVLVANADAYLAGAGLDGLLDGWDGTRVRLLGVPAVDSPAE